MTTLQLSFSDLIKELNDSWAEDVLRLVHSLSLSNAAVSADQVVEAMEGAGIEKERLYELPSILRKAVNKGWLEYARCSCGEEHRTVKSERKGNNGRRILLYRSTH